MGKIAIIVGGVFTLLLAALVVFVTGGLNQTAANNNCGVGSTDSSVQVIAGVPDRVGTWEGEQVQNAAHIVAQGYRMKVPARAQAIALMTAMGESSLRVLDYGDTAGPDSRGLFQQRDSWGTLEERMDPATSTKLFLNALLEVGGWATMEPTLAAHATQRNADPYHYTRWWDDALQMLEALADNDGVKAAAGGTLVPASTQCVLGQGPVGAVAWPIPVAMADSDRHNWGQTGAMWSRYHTGTDFSVAAGTPVYAAHAGTVELDSSQASWAGPYFVKITTGPDTLATWYAHMQGLVVEDGAQVVAGQQIGVVGELGNTSGPHLHFEVHLANGDIYGEDNTDPSTWLRENVGRTLGGTEQAALPDGSRGPVRVASLNVLGAHHTAPGGGKASWPAGADRQRGLMTELEASDISVVGFQEFESDQARVVVEDGDWTLMRGPTNGRFRGGGTTSNAIAWQADQWTAVGSNHVVVPWQRTLHMPVVQLRHNATGVQMIVMSIHNPATTRSAGDQSAARDRAVQIELQAARQLAASGLPVLLLGDFNERGARLYCPMTANQTFAAAAGGSRGGGDCNPPAYGGVDWVFGTTGVGFSGWTVDSSVRNDRLTDHPLVSAAITLGATT